MLEFKLNYSFLLISHFSALSSLFSDYTFELNILIFLNLFNIFEIVAINFDRTIDIFQFTKYLLLFLS